MIVNSFRCYVPELFTIMRSLCQPGPLNVLPAAVVYGDDGDNREDHVDRKQARAFEGFVTGSGDATTMLWNPLVGPDLRAALYKVLADTPGVRVNSHTKDDLGRAAVEISRTATATGIKDQTFENPKTGAVLETAFVYSDGTKGTDLYLSVTSRDTVPPNPYHR
jgi:hypothetical protein